jgi:hypothetical protein
MKRTLIALALAVYIGGVSVETSIAADQPQTPPSDWAKWLVPNPETGSSGLSLMAMNRLVNCEAASGQPITCVQNTTDSEIVGITCGSYLCAVPLQQQSDIVHDRRWRYAEGRGERQERHYSEHQGPDLEKVSQGNIAKSLISLANLP